MGRGGKEENMLMVLLFVLIVIGAWIMGIYNLLVRNRNLVNESWSGIDVQLKRRYDLIPNVIETVKGYAAHEKTLFEKVTQARASAIAAGSIKEKGPAENALTQAIRSVFAVAENYPDLKASQNFQDLQKNLNEIEGEIQAARRYYNGCVRDYNTSTEVVPNNLVANMFGFTKREFFEIEEAGQREVPKVSF